MKSRSRLGACVALYLAAGVAGGQQAPVSPTAAPTPAPIEIPPDAVGPAAEAAAKAQLFPIEATSAFGMVACGSREASAVGARILEAGGNAVDAAVATALALGVVEPGQSGLGGQTFILVHLADGRDIAIDGAAAAPLRAKREELRLLAETGQTNGYPMAATPGSLAALATAAEHYGSRPLPELIAPAIELAMTGSQMTAFQRTSLEHYVERVKVSAYTGALYLKDGKQLWEPEHRFCQPDLGRTLWRIADRGWRDFYSGEIAREIAKDMKLGGGFVQWGDLEQVRVFERPALRGRYRGLAVVSFPPPCAGPAVIEMLQILERFPAKALRAATADAVHVMIEAQRIASSDENNILSIDSPYVAEVISPEKAARRAAQIDLKHILPPDVIAGVANGDWRDRDTTHVAVVDRFGNAVSLTQSLGRGFGACVATRGLGFPYNAVLESYDLDFAGSRYYLFPLRRIFTSISPTIVLRDGRPMLVVGSAGSSHIAPAIVNTIVNVIDRGMGLGDALAAPRVLWGGGRLLYELVPPITPEIVTTLGLRGFTDVTLTSFPASEWSLTSSGGVNAVLVRDDGTMVGGCDPRRGGEPVGAAAAPDPSVPPVPPAEVWRGAFAVPPTPTPAPMRVPARTR
jgi:gamma-glutamyltranspeptidase / glutathione hydrolase